MTIEERIEAIQITVIEILTGGYDWILEYNRKSLEKKENKCCH